MWDYDRAKSVVEELRKEENLSGVYVTFERDMMMLHIDLSEMLSLAKGNPEKRAHEVIARVGLVRKEVKFLTPYHEYGVYVTDVLDLMAQIHWQFNEFSKFMKDYEDLKDGDRELVADMRDLNAKMDVMYKDLIKVLNRMQRVFGREQGAF